MAIIWGILLWILIIFLAIIGLIVVVFLILCFLPIKYHLFLKGGYDNLDYEIKVSVFRFSILPRKPKRRKKRKAQKKEVKVVKEKEAKEEPEKEEPEKEESNKLEKEPKKKPKKDTFKKIKKQWHLIEDFKFKIFKKPLKKIAKKLSKNLKPKIFNIKVEVGLDPYRTGLLMAFIYTMHLDDNIEIEANYEEEIIEGSLEMGGVLKLIYFITPAFNLFIPLLKLYLYRRRRLKQCKKNSIPE